MINTVPESVNDLVVCLAIFTIGAAICFWVGRAVRVPSLPALCIYAWHSAFCILYVQFVADRGGDAIEYYKSSFSMFREISLGTSAVTEITSIFSNNLQMSFLATSLVFNIAGAIGLLLFRANLQIAQGGRHWLQWVVILLPSMSFWTSSIGKDSLGLLSIGIFCWAVLQPTSRLSYLGLAFAVMTVVRAHVAIVMGIVGVYLAISQFRVAPVRALAVAVFAVLATIILLPTVMEKVRLETISFEDVGSLVERRENSNTLGGSSFDLGAMNYPMRVASYLFRPLPYEAMDALQFLVSVENTIHISFAASLVILVLSGRKIRNRGAITLLLFSVTLTVLLALTTANLGLAARQKVMVLVPIYIFFFSFVRRSSSTSRTPKVV